MALTECNSSDALRRFLQENPSGCIVTFSAHWCGPCKASKPQLEAMASASPSVKFGIVYESDLGDVIHSYNIKAFPTYILFQQSAEVQRVEGVNFAAIRDMMKQAGGLPTVGGSALGGDGATLTPEQARAQRLARLGGASTPTKNESMETDNDNQDDVKPEAMETEETNQEASKPEESEEDVKMVDPTADLDPEMIKTLTETMGFALVRAQKGLLYGNTKTVEGAVEWIMNHQDDEDIDNPIETTPAAQTMQSYKCNECGKILSNLANLELHANKTGHSDFEESTEAVKPLTPEEKQQKILELKELLKAKRKERLEAEKVDDVEREKQRRFMGKEMAKTREQLEAAERKRDVQRRKREKEAYKKERERIRAELAKDKAERQANKGKLSSKLGVEGYQPDGIQYDAPDSEQQHPDQHQAKKKKTHVNANKIPEYIEKVSSYRAGGDGGKCLKVLKAYVSNVVNNPDDDKFKTINMDNKAYKTKVKPFVGAKHLLLAVGFQPNDEQTALVLQDTADPEIMKSALKQLEAALAAYNV